MLGMPLADFMRFAGEHRVSVFPEYTAKELNAELRAGKRAVGAVFEGRSWRMTATLQR